MANEALKKEVLDTYNNFYVEGFKNNDISLINEIVEYPLTYVKDGVTTLVNEYPVNPVQLKQELGWSHSIDWQLDVSAANSQNAHVIASATRCREDGSVIEYVHAFYGFKKTNQGWKMHVLADLVF